MEPSDEEAALFRLRGEESATFHELTAPLLPQSDALRSTRNDDSFLDVNEPASPTKQSWVGPLLLLFVSFLFATLNISLRSLYMMPDPPPPATLSATRGWLIVAIFLPVLGHDRVTNYRTPSTKANEPVLLSQQSLWRAATELAVWNFLGQALYNFGIFYVSSARASFLGQTTVVLVPLICSLSGEALQWGDGIGCLSSLVGLIFLSVQEQPQQQVQLNDDEDSQSLTGPLRLCLGLGDTLILSSAVCWSFYLISTSKYANAYDALTLQGAKNGIQALLYTLWWAASCLYSYEDELWKGYHNATAWAILVYSAVGPGVVADLIQQCGQASGGATKATLILCMESVFTAVLGRLLLGEETSWIEKLGGACLMVGAAFSGRQTPEHLCCRQQPCCRKRFPRSVVSLSFPRTRMPSRPSGNARHEISHRIQEYRSRRLGLPVHISSVDGRHPTCKD
jgi:drug/metabolite transporter (DMT)-like permease